MHVFGGGGLHGASGLEHLFSAAFVACMGVRPELIAAERPLIVWAADGGGGDLKMLSGGVCSLCFPWRRAERPVLLSEGSTARLFPVTDATMHVNKAPVSHACVSQGFAVGLNHVSA